MSKKSSKKEVSNPLKQAQKAVSESGFTFIDEFKQFAIKGDMIDLAVGIIIGTGFNALVQSLVNDVIMPIFGWLLGDAKFTNLYIQLGGQQFDSLPEALEAGAPVIQYGAFIAQLVDFFIIALTVFIILRYFLRIKKKEAAK